MKLLTLPVSNEQKNSISNKIVHKALELADNHVDLVVFTIEEAVKKNSPERVVEVYTDYLVAKVFEDFNQEQLLENISSGLLYSVRTMIMKHLFNNEIVKESISYTKEIAV
jgi:hypothetical protein